MYKFGLAYTFTFSNSGCMTNDNLIKLQNGDPQVFREIYDEWSRKVFFYFLKKTNDDYAAKELTQQTFIKLWQYKDSISTEHSIDQQIFQKARLAFIDWLIKEATHRKYLVYDMPISADVAAHNPETAEALQQHIDLSLKSLPEKRRKVFELKHIHGYSYKEIADFLGISVKTVDNHLLKATAQLKKVFNL
jgi:RNA polymerase sigma factor (sigma-70 family)